LDFQSFNLILRIKLSQGNLEIMNSSNHDCRKATANGAEPFSFVRRRFLKTISFMAMAPIWTIACDRSAREGRQGADHMQTSENQNATQTTTSKRPIPEIDTRIPADIHTATFAMG
jgi:hypothetical protein